MKNVLIGILFITTAVFGGLYFNQTRETERARAVTESAKRSIGDLQSKLDEEEAQGESLREDVEKAHADVAAGVSQTARLRETIKTLQAAQANPPQPNTVQTPASGQTNSKSSSPLAEMFKNPEMKEMIRTQQKTALGPMLDKNYAKLFSDLHLTPEQAGAVKDLIMKKTLDAADMGLSLVSEDMDPEKRADLMKQVKDANDATDAQLKAYLGDENFAQYQTYEKTMAERNAVGGLKDQLASGPNALTDAQQEQLVQVMTQEKQNFKFTADLSDKSTLNGDIASMLTEERVNAYFQELGQLDQQYLTRAQAILSPDQAAEFGKYLKNQEGAQKAGLQLAAKLLAPAKPGGQ